MDPLAYMLTWTTYGTWLHGDTRLSVERGRPGRATAVLAPNTGLESMRRSQMKGEPVVLSIEERRQVHDAIEECCEYRGWHPLALNVRSNHAHCIVQATGCTPEQVMSDLKARATRRLREAGLRRSDQRIWTQRGSTRWLNNEEGLRVAMEYVLNQQ